MALPFFVAMVVFPAKAKTFLLMGFLVNEANCLKIIDYDRTKVHLALLLLNDFCRENCSMGSLAIFARSGPFEGIQKVLARGLQIELLSLE